ncbi:MAG: hypothetical protein ACYTHN_03210, partial [Planctomycetota bacterium]
MRARQSLSVKASLFACAIVLGLCGCSEEDRPPVDSTPPAAITDLVAVTGVSPGSVRLDWTAPGDNGMEGTAAGYVLVYSTILLTPVTFDAGTQYTQNWTPLPAGSAEIRILFGLNPGDHLYFAIKTFDAVGNLSAMSNVADTLVAVPDTTAPGRVTDLAAVPGTAVGSIRLTWTAPGDDGLI